MSRHDDAVAIAETRSAQNEAKAQEHEAQAQETLDAKKDAKEAKGKAKAIVCKLEMGDIVLHRQGDIVSPAMVTGTNEDGTVALQVFHRTGVTGYSELHSVAEAVDNGDGWFPKGTATSKKGAWA